MPSIRTTFFALFLLPFGGCLEFDAQEITMRYDAEADRIDFLLIYRGVCFEGQHADGPEAAADKAIEDLELVLGRGQCFVWSNWPLKIDVIDPPARTAMLAEHVEVENGGLFVDPRGVLNGYQFVRIIRASEFLKKVNTMLEIGVQAALLGGLRGVKFDEDTREIVTEFLRSGEDMLAVESGRIELRLPCTGEDFRKLLGLLDDYFVAHVPEDMIRRFAFERSQEQSGENEVAEAKMGLEDLRKGLKEAAGIRFFWDNEFTIERSEELQVIGIGVAGDHDLRLPRRATASTPMPC